MNKVISILIVLVITCNLVQAGMIQGLFNTGVDGSGSVLPLFSLDPHYALTGPSSPAIVIDRYVGPGGNEWIAAPVGSAWIGPSSSYQTDPVGLYTYSLSFELTGLDPGLVTISGLLAADNTPEIYLNGLNVGFSHPTQYFSLEPFTISNGFQAGINTLEFRVSNNPTSGHNPTGLLVADLTGTASPIPAPGAIWLLGTGLIGIMGIRKRVRKIIE